MGETYHQKVLYKQRGMQYVSHQIPTKVHLTKLITNYQYKPIAVIFTPFMAQDILQTDFNLVKPWRHIYQTRMVHKGFLVTTEGGASVDRRIHPHKSYKTTHCHYHVTQQAQTCILYYSWLNFYEPV